MNVAIVVAAGKGTRLGGNRPKQFIELDGVPIIIHTLRQFERCEAIKEIIVVVPAESTAAFSSLAEKFEVRKLSRVVSGGDHRMAMALAVAGLVADGETVVEDTACVHTSFPAFVDTLNALAGGPAITVEA